MKSLYFLLLISLLFFSQCEMENETKDFELFTGLWKLQNIERQDTLSGDWEVASGLNRNREGFIIYDGKGGMGVHHVPEHYYDYEFEVRGPLDSFSRKDLRHLANNFVYFGKYRILDKEDIIEHHIESSINPFRKGTIARRRYEFDGDTLSLYPLTSNSGIPSRIIWTKVNDNM